MCAKPLNLYKTGGNHEQQAMRQGMVALQRERLRRLPAPFEAHRLSVRTESE